ncbi:hypothetical protein ACFLVC_04365 [Chloroflexota bacterium]
MAEEQSQPDNQQDQPDEQPSQPDKPKRKSGRGRRRLITLAIVIAILVIVACVFFNLPQRIGVVQSPTEKILSTTPDREATTAMMEDLKSAGINTKGIDIYVIPYKGSDENVAIAVLDASQGFDVRNFSREDAITEYLELLASLDTGGEYNIKRVAVDYKNEEGESLLTLTAPTDIITRYADGSISRQQFLKELEGQVNFVEIAEMMAEEVR